MLTRKTVLKKAREDWGLTLIPLSNDTKKPRSKWTGKYDDEGKKIYSWKKSKGIEWSDEELLAASRWGVDHEASGTIDADFDDVLLNAHKFIDLLPDTLTIGKNYNGSGIPTANHKLFFIPKDVEIKTESYPKNVKGKGEKIIELLPNTQSHYFGDREIIADIAPKRLTESEFQHVRQTTGEIYFLAMASKHYPPKGKKQRDEYIMRLVGVMVQHTDWPTSKREDYLKRLLIANNDTEEITNRVNKIKYQEDQLKAGKTVFGIPALVEFIGADKKAGLDWIDAIKKENKKGEEYPLVSARQFIANDYPVPKFILFPIFTERSANQIFGGYESGKTMFGLSAAMYMCSGADFAGFKSQTKVPSGYVEGELPASDVRDRFNSIRAGMEKLGIEFNWDWFHILTKDDLAQAGFKYGFDPIAVSRNLSDADAKDYGRRGREHISTWVRKIERKTGAKPFFNLDNITALADIDENRAPDWKPLIQWLINEKNKGFANCFYHHANKTTTKGGSSGSNAKERLLDTSMAFEKLDAKHRFNMGGNKNVQCKVHFDKARNFGGSSHDQDFILTCTEEGKWTRYPYLDKYDFMIIKYYHEGFSVKDMAEMEGLKKKIEGVTIYKRLKRLKDMGAIIEDEKSNF